ncbi:MAG: hypothetical protein ACOCWC_05120 [Bacteroidota bacterium]
MKRSILYWIIAIVITLITAYYQRTTGPTYPYRGKVEIANEEVNYKLIRTYAKPSDAEVKVKIEDESISGHYKYKRYPSNDEWTYASMVKEGEHLIAYIPQQDPAGKVMYQVFLEDNENEVKLSEEPLIIRYRGDVPAWALIPHIIFMFAAMLFSMRAGIAAIAKEKTFIISMLTVITLIIGGLIFGPIVQKFAFGEYWTGWPFGTDLTDNKTAIAFIFWAFALIKAYRNPKHRTWVLVASIVLLVIFLIPHSLMGSEIDYTQAQ